MGLKKTFCVILTFILLFISGIPVFAEQPQIVSLGMISIAMPDIAVEIKGKIQENENISATLESQNLTVESVSAYDPENDAICAYLLVDLSTSMYGSFDLVKKNINTYINSLNENDRVVLITFGEKDVRVVLDGSESRDDAKKAVDKLLCNEDGTLFYEALSTAYKFASSSSEGFAREYVIAFSDGVDLQKGNTTFSEVLEQYRSHELPLYAACCENTSKDAADKFGELARISGGEISLIENENSFKSFLKTINDVTIVKFKAQSNYADGKDRQLSIKIGSAQVNCNVPIVHSTADTVAPKVEQIAFDAENNIFLISFSEEVEGAQQAASYIIKNSKGKSIEVVGVTYSETTGVYSIKVKEQIKKDTYTFEFSGITDISQEANPVSDKLSVIVKKNAKVQGLSITGLAVIIVAVVFFVLVIAVIVILTSKKKPSESSGFVDYKKNPTGTVVEKELLESANVKHHLKVSASFKVGLAVKTGSSAVQNISIDVLSSAIIGRSDVCDVYIDDPKLSRQHFAIENENGGLYLTDLNSSNGTFLNGIRIGSRRKLKSGDKITAGLSEIIITILK